MQTFGMQQQIAWQHGGWVAWMAGLPGPMPEAAEACSGGAAKSSGPPC